MKKVLIFISCFYLLNRANAQLQTATNAGNTTTNALRITGEGLPGASGSAELYLGVLSAQKSNDSRTFIGWKNDAGTNPTTNGSAGTLLLQARTNISDVGIDFATGFNTAALRMRIAGNGNVSIGDNSLTPASRLLIKGSGTTNATSSLSVQNSAGTDLLKVLDNGTTRIYNILSLLGTQQAPNYILANEGADNSQLFIKAGATSTVFSQIEVTGNWNGTASTGGKVAFSTSGVERMRIDAGGNVFATGKLAIGTTDLAKIGTYSLAVNGNAIFNKVKVMSYATWADYVFEEKYNLLPLPQLEQFINLNKHLPDVPSASDVEKDGIDLGDNQTLLLKKVEELTLYLIEQNKKLEEQGSEINSLKKQLSQLEKK